MPTCRRGASGIGDIPVRLLRAVIRVGRIDHGEHAADPLGLAEAEQGHAHAAAPGDAHLVGRHADQPAFVSDQHDSVAGPNREASDDRGTVAGGKCDVGDALAAPPGNPVFIGGRPLAEAGIGHR